MKFKLDENFGTRTYSLFESAGHDVKTVRQEGMQGVSDQELYEKCRAEARCLVTLDLDFADVIRFPPDQSEGIVVLRLPNIPSLFLLEKLVGQLLQTLDQPMGASALKRKLWIVELGRIRIHQD